MKKKPAKRKVVTKAVLARRCKRLEEEVRFQTIRADAAIQTVRGYEARKGSMVESIPYHLAENYQRQMLQKFDFLVTEFSDKVKKL